MSQDHEVVPFPEGVIVREQEPLARHVPHRVGGPCDAYIVIHDRGAVLGAMSACRDRNWARNWLGAGTRVVPRDGGIAGAVLRLGQDFVGIRDDGDGWWVGAATPVSWLAGFAGGPLEALKHWPGTLGASWAHDEGWAPWLDRVRVVRRGHETELDAATLDSTAGLVFLEARVRRDVRAKPPRLPMPGGWFAPTDDGDDVGKLLRDADLAGTRLRSVMLPEELPDHIVNLGDASTKDVTTLLKGVIDRVHQARGVMLTDRMTWWGRNS